MLCVGRRAADPQYPRIVAQKNRRGGRFGVRAGIAVIVIAIVFGFASSTWYSCVRTSSP